MRIITLKGRPIPTAEDRKLAELSVLHRSIFQIARQKLDESELPWWLLPQKDAE